MKLHLGCGKRILPGYVNIDAIGGDRQMDIRKLDYPDNSVEEILAVHVWEHFWLNEVVEIASEWRRVLIPGGKLILEMPRLEKVMHYIIQSRVNNTPMAANMTLWAMYGDPSTIRSEQDLHKWLWGMGDIKLVLTSAGFREIQILEPEHHVKARDMRVEAIK